MMIILLYPNTHSPAVDGLRCHPPRLLPATSVMPPEQIRWADEDSRFYRRKSAWYAMGGMWAVELESRALRLVQFQTCCGQALEA